MVRQVLNKNSVVDILSFNTKVMYSSKGIKVGFYKVWNYKKILNSKKASRNEVFLHFK